MKTKKTLISLFLYKIKIIYNTNNGDHMDINEALSIIPRSLISLLTLFIATKILGKKQVSELSLFDYVIGISIGNFTAEMILVLEPEILMAMEVSGNTERILKMHIWRVVGLVEDWGIEGFKRGEMIRVLNNIMYLTEMAKGRLMMLEN